MGGNALTAVPLCTVQGCPAPSDPGWHIPWCGHGLAGEHQHVPKRSQGGKQIASFLCPECHRQIDSGPWGNAVLDIPGVGKVYRAWDHHNVTLIERVIEPVSLVIQAHTETSSSRALSPSESGREEGEEVGHGLSPARDEAGVASGVASAVLITPPATAPASMPTRDQWCREGMRLLEAGLAIKGAIDAWQWAVGDWALQGEQTEGHEANQYFTPFEAAFGRDRMRELMWVAEAFPPVARATLSWSHHRALAALAHQDAPRARELLTQAETEGLGVRQVRALLASPQRLEEPYRCPACGYAAVKEEFMIPGVSR